ncbi:MAG: PEP-CTERM sorting domain-containing protein [Planctomycetota bacterium]
MRTALLSITANTVFCCCSFAAITLDPFTVLDQPNDFASTPIIPGVSVEVADNNGGSVPEDIQDRYVFNAPNIGDTFVARYDWAGTFGSLFASDRLSLERVPIGAFLGNWSMFIDNGTGSPELFPGPALPTVLPSPLDLQNSTFLQFTFTYLGGSPLPSGGVGTFGGIGNPLAIAVPEPTSFAVLAGLGSVVAVRRRQRRVPAC